MKKVEYTLLFSIKKIHELLDEIEKEIPDELRSELGMMYNALGGFCFKAAMLSLKQEESNKDE